MSLKVDIIRTRFPHWGDYSGFHQFFRYLQPEKYRATLHAVSDSNADFPIRNKRIQNVAMKWVQRGKMKWYKLSDLTIELKFLLRCFGSEPPVIVHFLDGEHSARYLPLFRKAFLRKKPKIAAVFHQPPAILSDLIDTKIIRCLDAIHVVSPDQVEYFAKFVNPNRIRLILHGIDTDFFRPQTRTAPSDKFRCLTVGHYLRDFNLLGEICRRLTVHQDMEFILVGPSIDGIYRFPNVKIYRGIGDEELRTLYRQSDLLLLPMLHCTANNALLEGIACGLPVVGSLLPGTKAYLPGEEGLLISGNEPDGFVKAILHVAKNPLHRQRMAAAARARALELDWRKITPLFEAEYDRLAHAMEKASHS